MPIQENLAQVNLYAQPMREYQHPKWTVKIPECPYVDHGSFRETQTSTLPSAPNHEGIWTISNEQPARLTLGPE